MTHDIFANHIRNNETTHRLTVIQFLFIVILTVIIATLWLAFVSATAFSIWNHLSTLFPVTLLASYRFLIPVCGVLEAILLLKAESPGWGLAIGGLLVAFSMILAKRTSPLNPVR